MPAWRGDGLLLAYAASPLAGGSFDIWTVDPAGGKPRRVVTGAAEQVVPVVRARRQARVPDSSSRASRSPRRRATPARPRSARASCSPTSTSARRSGSRSPARSSASPRRPTTSAHGPVWIRGSRPVAGGHDARAAARPDVGRLGAHLRRRGPPPLHALAVAHALAPARLPALRAPHARRRSRRARPEERLLPRRPLRARPAARPGLQRRSLLRQLRRLEPARALRRAGHVDRLHRPLPRPLPRPEPRAPRRARRDLRARPPRQPDAAARGDRLHEQRRVAPGPPHLERRRAGRRDAAAAARAQPTARPSAAGSENRSGSRSGSSGRRPSRSSRNACIPSARAPSMSSS